MRRTPASSLVCPRSLPARSPRAALSRAALSRAALSRAALSRAALSLSFLVALLAGAGCSKQGEGERCDLNNGDLDCDTGLICVGEEQISITGTGVALCCPITDPTVDACRASTTLPPEPDAGVTPPAPPPVTTTPDAGNAATPDAGNTPAPVTPDASTSDGGT